MKFVIFRLFNAEDEQGRQTGRLVKMYVAGGEPDRITYTAIQANANRYETEREADEQIIFLNYKKHQKEQVHE